MENNQERERQQLEKAHQSDLKALEKYHTKDKMDLQNDIERSKTSMKIQYVPHFEEMLVQQADAGKVVRDYEIVEKKTEPLDELHGDLNNYLIEEYKNLTDDMKMKHYREEQELNHKHISQNLLNELSGSRLEILNTDSFERLKKKAYNQYKSRQQSNKKSTSFFSRATSFVSKKMGLKKT